MGPYLLVIGLRNYKSNMIMKKLYHYLNAFFLLTLFLLVSFRSQAQWVEKDGITSRGGAEYFVLNNKLYITGGYIGFTTGYQSDMQMFDPATGKWDYYNTPVPSNRTAGISFALNGKGYVGLGEKYFLGFSPPPEIQTDLNAYDPATDQWTKVAYLPDSGRIGSAVFVLKGKAYVVGGEKGKAHETTNEVWEYDPSSDQWTRKADLPVKVSYASGFSNATTASTTGFVTGGLDETNTTLNKTFAYDPMLDSWTEKANMPISNQGGTAFVIDENAYYGLGSNKELGANGAAFPTDFYRYNMSLDQWELTNMKLNIEGRLWPVSCVIDRKIYVGTGYKYDAAEYAFGDIYEYSKFTGIDGTPLSNNLGIYPNPANDKLFVDTDLQGGTIQVMDIHGVLLKEVEFINHQPLDVSDLASGVYLIRLENKNLIQTSRVNITH